jgi:hypothetical protein
MNVGTGALAARCGLTNLRIAWFHVVTDPCPRGETAKRLLQVVVPFAAHAAKLLAAHGMVHIAALDVPAAVAREGRNVWVGAGCAKPELAAGDEVGIRQLEVRGHWDSVQKRVPTSKAEHARSVFRGVSSINVFLCKSVRHMLRHLFATTRTVAVRDAPVSAMS